MTKTISLLILIITTSSPYTASKKAETIEIEGIIIFTFLKESDNSAFSCPLKTKILIEGIEYDFIPSRTINSNIIRENPEFISALGPSTSYDFGDIFIHNCMYRPNSKISAKINCDSIAEIYKKYNVWDKELFRPSLEEELMTETIYSNNIFQTNDSKVLKIAIGFKGTVIKYSNVIFGEQEDYRIIRLEDGATYFDASHGSCPFEKLDKNFVVLSETKELYQLSNRQISELNLKHSSFKRIQIFLHE